MSFSYFTQICERTALPLCHVIADTAKDQLTEPIFGKGIIPLCYARSIEVANTVIFQIGNAFINIGALVVVLIMIYSIRSKYTAIGRSEMLFFFNLILALLVLTLVVDCGVSPPGSSSYPYFVAIQLGFAGAACWCIMICGLLSFRIWEDGTVKSLLFLRSTSFIIGAINFIVAILTFQNWISNGGIDDSKTLGLFITSYVLNGVFLLFYLFLQICLAVFIIRDWWVLGAIFLSLGLFIVGQVLMYAFSKPICEGVKHYIDGLFFGSICNLFALMMLYKVWDMTTDDDLEFSISINKKGEISFSQR